MEEVDAVFALGAVKVKIVMLVGSSYNLWLPTYKIILYD